jgi:maleate isomerase
MQSAINNQQSTMERDGWGSRARIGVLAAHNGVVAEGELWAMLPEGVSLHTARVPLGWRGPEEVAPLATDVARAFAAPPHVDAAAELLAAAPLNVIVYAFTGSSYVLGPEGDAALQARLEARTRAIPVLVTCVSAGLGLRTLGIRRLALIHPPWYTAELNRLGAEYFQALGFEVVCADVVGLSVAQLDVQPGQVYDWVRAHAPAAAEAIFFGGNGFRVIAVIKALEEALGRPVLSANQVLIWHALRVARVPAPVVNYGQIFGRELPG